VASGDKSEPMDDAPVDMSLLKVALQSAREMPAGERPELYVTLDITHPGVQVPEAMKTGEKPELTIVMQNQFWDLDVLEDEFAVTLSFDAMRERVIVPFSSIRGYLDCKSDAYVGDVSEEIAPFDVDEQEDELPASISEIPQSALSHFREKMDEFRATLCGAAILPMVVYLIGGLITVLFLSQRLHVPPTHLMFASYLNPTLANEMRAGHVNFVTFYSTPTFLGGFALLYAGAMALLATSMVLPFKEETPLSMHLTLGGLIASYAATLLVYHVFRLDYSLVMGAYRAAWILLFLGLSERLKRSYSEEWAGVKYFGMTIDGIFALSATYVIKQGLDDRYDLALSGPLFLILFFLYMLVTERRAARRRMIRTLQRQNQRVPDFETLNELEQLETRGNLREALKATRILSRAIFRKNRELEGMSYAELTEAYKKNNTNRLVQNYVNWQRFEFGQSIGIGLLLTFWGALITLPLWAAANWWLWIFH
jgi:hypothetical protein